MSGVRLKVTGVTARPNDTAKHVSSTAVVSLTSNSAFHRPYTRAPPNSGNGTVGYWWGGRTNSLLGGLNSLERRSNRADHPYKHSNYNTNGSDYQSNHSDINTNISDFPSNHSNSNTNHSEYRSKRSDFNTNRSDHPYKHSNYNTNRSDYPSNHSDINTNHSDFPSNHSNSNTNHSDYRSKRSDFNINRSSYQTDFSDNRNKHLANRSVYQSCQHDFHNPDQPHKRLHEQHDFLRMLNNFWNQFIDFKTKVTVIICI